MTKIDEIRNTFSKGNIIFSEGSISIIYSNHDWVTQSIDNGYKDIFSCLLESSEKFSIRIKNGSSIRLGFLSNKSGQIAMYYSPLEKENENSGIDDIIKEMRPTKEFKDFFDGVNMSNDDEVFNKIVEWTDKVSEKFKRKIRNVDKIKIWPEIKSKAIKFANTNGCQTDITDPDDISDGSIDIQVPENLTRPLLFTGDNKQRLIDLVNMCEEVALEMNPQKGYFDIILLL